MDKHSTRQVLALDSDWKFHLGEVSSPVPNTHIAAYMANKAGWARGAAKGNFDDSDWRAVELPHDWSVEGKFDAANHVDAGFLPRGVGWYRRHFRLEAEDRGKYLALVFEGVATHCSVYVNGHLLGRNCCGYTPFTVEFGDVANFGDELNVVAVKVDATYMEGWWYEGAGIYRHVRLIKTSPVHIVSDGVFVCPRKLIGGGWDTAVETTISNDLDLERNCRVFCEIFDPAGRSVGRSSQMITVAGRSRMSIEQKIQIESPELWSMGARNLYRLRAEVFVEENRVDDEVVSFGYRTIRFDAEKGFFLNDEPVKLKGTCNHQDHAGVGVAVPDSIHRFRIRRLLDMGSNSYRCAHNPPARELLDACDELGMLVMDENRNFGSSPEHLEQVRKMVTRDRNHPSVILWSICNEEAVQGTPVGGNLARAMREEIHRLDPSRPMTAAVSGGILNDEGVADFLDVMGINYQLSLHDQYHAKRPGRPLVAAETHCANSTRGVYATDPARFVFASYDSDAAAWGASARETWRTISSRSFVAGLFAWTGFDYRGEPSPHEWPCVNSYFGIMDTCGFAKDSFFLHKAFFTSEPFVHVFPHWNWTGEEGKKIRVMAYSNCEEVELLVNGESRARRKVDPIEMAEWEVDFAPGELRAVAYRGNEIVAQSAVETTGAAVALGMEIHPSFDAQKILADGRFALPISVFALDSQGRRVPTAGNLVTFAAEGPGRILGVGNGDPTCHEADKGVSRSLFNGLAQVIVQTTTMAGRIRLSGSSAGLRSAALEMVSVAGPVIPSVAAAKVRHLIRDWRRSPISRDRLDVNQKVVEQDMNSWERIDPGHGAQKAEAGYAIYRAKFRLPKIWQATGCRMRFEELIGEAEVYVNGAEGARKPRMEGGALELALRPSAEELTVSVLIRMDASPAGITQPVELLR